MIKNLFVFIFVLQSLNVFADPSPHQYTIGTYNVSNLWDADPSNTPQIWADFQASLPNHKKNIHSQSPQYAQFDIATSNYYNPKILQAKVNNIVSAIKLSGIPDILALQEFESAGNQSKIWEMPYDPQTTFKEALEKLGYQYFFLGFQEKDNPVSVTPAVISKVPLKQLQAISVHSGHNTSGRNIMVLEWDLPQSRVVLINGHFKSKRDGGDSLRESQARAVRDRIHLEKTLDPTSRVIVLGDLNSTYYEPVMKLMGSTGDEASMLTESGTPNLLNLWYELKEDQRWESSFGGAYGTLSHILISHDFFYKYGLSYDPGSFHAVGQTGPEAEVLLNPEGVPFDWQIQARGKHFVHHIGKGYSDHLPLVASFTFTTHPPDLANVKKKIQDPFHEDSSYSPHKIFFSHVKVCDEHEALDYKEVDWNDIDSYYGKCVKIIANKGFPLSPRGKHHTNFITLPVENKSHEDNHTFTLAIGMSRHYDWRPNIDDSRVSLEEASLPEGGSYDFQSPHPHSNQCYARKVLQGEGGELRKIVGRISYQNGNLSILAASREPRHIELIHLPEPKLRACPW